VVDRKKKPVCFRDTQMKSLIVFGNAPRANLARMNYYGKQAILSITSTAWTTWRCEFKAG